MAFMSVSVEVVIMLMVRMVLLGVRCRSLGSMNRVVFRVLKVSLPMWVMLFTCSVRDLKNSMILMMPRLVSCEMVALTKVACASMMYMSTVVSRVVLMEDVRMGVVQRFVVF